MDVSNSNRDGYRRLALWSQEDTLRESLPNKYQELMDTHNLGLLLEADE